MKENKWKLIKGKEDIMIDYIKNYIINNGNWEDITEELKSAEHMKTALHIFAEMMPAMWW